MCVIDVGQKHPHYISPLDFATSKKEHTKHVCFQCPDTWYPVSMEQPKNEVLLGFGVVWQKPIKHPTKFEDSRFEQLLLFWGFLYMFIWFVCIL